MGSPKTSSLANKCVGLISKWGSAKVRSLRFIHLLAVLLTFVPLAAADGRGRVSIDSSRTQEHRAWAESAECMANEWYPRLGNLLSSSPRVELPDVVIELSPDYDGVAAASGRRITLSSKWVRDHPEDARGVVVHELVHVVQAYPENREGWVTEGIADFIRYGLFEAWPLERFPRPAKPHPYTDGYQTAGGFLLWLEGDASPGIVRRLNTALRGDAYGPGTFREITGRSADDLWAAYVAAVDAPQQLPAETTRFRYGANGGGLFERKDAGAWAEMNQGGEIWRFKEVARTTTYIELLDESRGLRLRLTASEVQLSRREGWSTLYAAGWDPKPRRQVTGP